MTDTNFVELVKEMRRAQIRYFSGDKSQTCVSYCKKLEKQVDAAIRDATEANLFDEVDQNADDSDVPY